MSIVFTLDKASFEKSGISVLNDLSLQIPVGQHTAIIGGSGSGKTTLLDVFSSKLFPKQGKFNVNTNGKIISVPRDYGFHKIVGAAYQYYQQRYTAMDAEIGPNLYEVFQNQIQALYTVNQNSVELAPPQYTDDEVLEVCRLFKLEHLLYKKITSLSNGETRRSLLALSILKKPTVLLLDEPYSGLDSQHREELSHILANLTDVQIIMTAAMTDLPKNISHIIYLEDGKVVFYGKRAEYENYKVTTEVKKPKIPFPKLKNENLPFQKAVELRNGSVKYGDKQVLSGINWEIKKGERWALMGPNGSGKSSLLSLITGDNLQCYNNDLSLFDKRRGSGESIWELKRKIGYVSPELHLYFNKAIRVWKVLASGFFDTIGLFSKLNTAQEEQLEKCIQYFNLQNIRERQLSQLSFGEQRMVFLARALIKNPALLILDEPCQGLDYAQMIRFRALVDDICADSDTTLIFVSHYPAEIPACVHKTLYLEAGQMLKITEK